MDKKTNKIRISMTINPDLYEKAKKQAAKENRTFANWIETVITKHIWITENDH